MAGILNILKYPSNIDIEQLNPLDYWRTHSGVYPILSQMARDYLSIPASSVPSEQIFSRGGDVVTKKRNRLNADTIGMILCLKNWRGFGDKYIEEDILEE